MKLLLLLFFLQSVSAGFQYLGCYSSSAFSESGTYYLYQSMGYCEDQCAGYKYAALTNASYCLCSNDDPSSSNSASNNQCSVPCSGYPSNICGADDYFSVYYDSSLVSGVSSSGSASSTSSSSSLSSSSSSSSLSSSSSTTTLKPSSTITTTSSSVASTISSSGFTTIESTSLSLNTDSGKTITSAVIIKTTEGYSNVYVTYVAAPTSTSSNLTDSVANSTVNKGGLYKGGIAGIVVGVVAAACVFLGVLFFIYRQRRRSKDLENAAIAATVVAKTHPGDSPERQGSNAASLVLRSPTIHGLASPGDHDDMFSGAVIGSTGDGSAVVSPTNATFSRNPSSRLMFNTTPTTGNNNYYNHHRRNSSIVTGASQAFADGNYIGSGTTDGSQSGLGLDFLDGSYDHDDTNSKIRSDCNEQDDDIDPIIHDSDLLGEHDEQDEEELLHDYSSSSLSSPGLRIMNPDNESVRSGISGLLDPRNHHNNDNHDFGNDDIGENGNGNGNTHTIARDNSILNDDSDDDDEDLFKHRLLPAGDD